MTTSALPWHDGELAVQRRVGEAAIAVRSAGAIRGEIPDVAAEFLAQQPLIVVTGTDQTGDVWTTLLAGSPGFIRTTGPRTVEIDALPSVDDPLGDVLRFGAAAVGMIAIEPATRRRIRLNGTSSPLGDTGLRVDLDQVFGNCPKYIAARTPTGDPVGAGGPPTVAAGLDGAIAQLLRRTDAFFMGTTDARGNADSSHRGGRPGFVTVEGDRVTFPDYVGNSMYTTLGNLEVNPRLGLLVPDFETGDTVHLTGTAEVDFDAVEAVPGARRMVSMTVTRAIRLPRRMGLSWSAAEQNRFSPDLAVDPDLAGR